MLYSFKRWKHGNNEYELVKEYTDNDGNKLFELKCVKFHRIEELDNNVTCTYLGCTFTLSNYHFRALSKI